jgi:3'-5' exoribonuclease
MPKELYIADIAAQANEGIEIKDKFLVKRKILGETQNRKPYLNLQLKDRTGELDARVWEKVHELSREFNQGDVVKIIAKVVNYQGRVQLKVYDIEPAAQEEVDWSDFLPASKYNSDELTRRISEIVSEFKSKHLRSLIRSFLKDKKFMREFTLASAAKALHHCCLGGLLEHTWSVMELALAVASRYPLINKDILVTGAFLHDIGKVQELTFRQGFDYSTEGRLIGHITMGAEMLDKKISQIKNFPPELALQLKHMILSHHGVYEYGSPKRPKTIEALALYYIDDLDAKISGFEQELSASYDPESGWTGFSRILDRFIFRDPRLTGQKEAEAAEPETDGDQPTLFDEET